MLSNYHNTIYRAIDDAARFEIVYGGDLGRNALHCRIGKAAAEGIRSPTSKPLSLGTSK